MPKLVIVESPAKAKTIGKYLGRGYKVTASMGHVRDLPASTLGIDVENGYTPKYITIKGKQKLVKELKAEFPHKVSIHNSCHGVRELHLSSPSERNIPYFSKLRDLLSLVKGIEIFEPKRVDECCGFGGMFAIEEPEVSVCMGQDKVKDHMSTGAEYITGADSSCLMHMEGVIKRDNLPIKTIHIVEILASGL